MPKAWDKPQYYQTIQAAHVFAEGADRLKECRKVWQLAGLATRALSRAILNAR